LLPVGLHKYEGDLGFLKVQFFEILLGTDMREGPLNKEIYLDRSEVLAFCDVV